MIFIVFAILSLAGAIYLFNVDRKRIPEDRFDPISYFGRWVALALAIVFFVPVSIVYVGKYQVAVKNKIYAGSNLPQDKVIATAGELGPQAEIIGPGFHFMPLVRVINDIEKFDIVHVKEGQIGMLSAKDGQKLPEGEFMAPEWAENEFSKMLNAEYFLTKGHGYKGPQVSVLKPGYHRINPYLFTVKLAAATDIPAGFVGVVRSSVTEPDAKGCSGSNDSKKSSFLVPKGCAGIWRETLSPKMYYLHRTAYQITPIPTRLKVLTYKGGYTQRKIDLSVQSDGSIKQSPSSKPIAVPDGATDGAITVRVQGWTVPVEVRVVIKVASTDASLIVASVGDIVAVEQKIITPAIRDALRSIGGREEQEVLNFITKRAEIAKEIKEYISPAAKKAGVTVMEVRLGEAAIPPELLVARLRNQLATQLAVTYEQERVAQVTRVAAENARATADQQSTLVEAQIGKEAARIMKDTLRLQGEGQKLKLQEIAQGQKAQSEVLGPELTAQLQIAKQVVEAAVKNPAIVKVPVVNVGGSADGGLAGAAAILGASNLTNMVGGMRVKTK